MWSTLSHHGTTPSGEIDGSPHSFAGRTLELRAHPVRRLDVAIADRFVRNIARGDHEFVRRRVRMSTRTATGSASCAALLDQTRP
jgi:hypothetical protein